jgi:hypothetical protein
MNRCLLSFAIAARLFAQPKTPELPDASVSGVVKDAVSGEPLAGYNVSTYTNVTWVGDSIFMSPTHKEVKSVTDAYGRYKLSGLPPGPYRIEAGNAAVFGNSMTKRVTLAGQDLEGIDFRFKVDGWISGMVIDEYKEPVPGINVYLVSPEYFGGELGYFIASIGRTDDRGEYKLTRVAAEHTYLVMASQRMQKVPPHSMAPVDPRLRRRVPMRTFYPNATTPEGAGTINVRPGEHREGVNIEVRKSANYCLDAVLSGPMGPGEIQFSVEGAQPSFGMSSAGGFPFSGTPTGKTGPDGKLRFCDLSPGIYRLTAFDQAPQNSAQVGPNRATTLITIVDQDVHAKLGLTPGPVVAGEVVFDGQAPAEPITTKLNVRLTPLLRPQVPGERPSALSAIPGTFSLNSMTTGDYTVYAMFNLPGTYVKDVRYAGQSILYQPLRAGENAGTGLSVVLARDGATVSARVTDKDGAPVRDIPVLLLPVDAATPAVVQAAMVTGATDQQGQYTSQTIAPGKYYVVATDSRIDATPECIDRLWRSRNKFTETSIAPNAATQLTLTPVTL